MLIDILEPDGIGKGALRTARKVAIGRTERPLARRPLAGARDALLAGLLDPRLAVDFDILADQLVRDRVRDLLGKLWEQLAQGLAALHQRVARLALDQLALMAGGARADVEQAQVEPVALMIALGLGRARIRRRQGLDLVASGVAVPNEVGQPRGAPGVGPGIGAAGLAAAIDQALIAVRVSAGVRGFQIGGLVP